jgi:amino-acid N-acetyltransferase
MLRATLDDSSRVHKRGGEEDKDDRTLHTSLSEQDSSSILQQAELERINGAAAGAAAAAATAMPEPKGLAESSGLKNATSPWANDVLAIDPSDVEIVAHEEEEIEPAEQQPASVSDILRMLPFVSMFRGSANYIANHRNTIAVYHVPGGLLTQQNDLIFRDLMNDVALTWLLGMKIVIVAGCRHQIEQRVVGTDRRHGLRVTDERTLRIVKEEAGYVRFEVERQLARSLRMQGSGGGGGSTATKNTRAKPTHPGAVHGFYEGNVVSGNFYSAQPFGILDGTDFKYTGFVRRVEVEKIRQVHAAKDICLLTTLGVSPSGEVFNVNSESLAATVGGALGAAKVIYFTEQEMEIRHKVHGTKIQNLRLSDARHLLQYHGIQVNKRGYMTFEKSAEEEEEGLSIADCSSCVDMLMKIGWCTAAIELGVKRAHIISPKHGALLQELYTRDGSGTLISADLYEGIRRATVTDVSCIHDIISPLIQRGTLIDRPKTQLEKDIDTYYVYTRDEHIVACGQLKKFEDGFAEIGCLVVNSEYRGRGRGDAMLGYLERLCLLNQCSKIFVLSTQTMEWFIERGFEEVGVDQLPPSRQATYNHKRASKIYMKRIESSRDLDASELWWNR